MEVPVLSVLYTLIITFKSAHSEVFFIVHCKEKDVLIIV